MLQTYKGMLFILCPKPVASWEEGVRICSIKPLEVTQVHTEPHLKETQLNVFHRQNFATFIFFQSSIKNSSETFVVNVPAFA